MYELRPDEAYLGGHHTVEHSAGEYSRDGVNTNTAESYFALVKRAIVGALVHISPKNLMRMFSAKGNSTANKLFNIIHTLQQKEGVQFQVQALR